MRRGPAGGTLDVSIRTGTTCGEGTFILGNFIPFKKIFFPLVKNGTARLARRCYVTGYASREIKNYNASIAIGCGEEERKKLFAFQRLQAALTRPQDANSRLVDAYHRRPP